jgi:hypothetical protein
MAAETSSDRLISSKVSASRGSSTSSTGREKERE